VNTTDAAIRADFLAANPVLSREMLALRCDSQYLAEVRICMDKSLQPRQCGNDVRSFCRGDRVIVRPVR
jgi:ribonuclease T2